MSLLWQWRVCTKKTAMTGNLWSEAWTINVVCYEDNYFPKRKFKLFNSLHHSVYLVFSTRLFYCQYVCRALSVENICNETSRQSDNGFTARTGTIKRGASLQSSPKINRMLITRLICIQWKSRRFLSPVSTVFARNVSEYGIPFA